MRDRIQDYATVGIVHFMMWKDTIRGGGDHRSVDTVLSNPCFGGIEVTWINDAVERAALAARQRLMRTTAENVAAFQAGRPINIVN